MFPAFANALALKNPLADANVTDIPSLVTKITNYVMAISGSIATIMVLVGAFQMISASGNETKFQQGKKTITYAVIGLAVVLAASGVTKIVENFLK